MSQTSQATSAPSEAQRGLRYRVLIVEDDADIRELIRYNLAQEGFIVEEAADGAQALEKVKRRVPDLMVLDLMLPGMPGLQVCRAVIRNPDPGIGIFPNKNLERQINGDARRSNHERSSGFGIAEDQKLGRPHAHAGFFRLTTVIDQGKQLDPLRSQDFFEFLDRLVD